MVCRYSVFVDTHYNKYSQLESQTVREAGRNSRSVNWLAAEFVGPEKGNCAYRLADGSRACLRDAGRSFPRVSWLAVELLALKRGVGVAVGWSSFCPAEQRAVPCGRGGVAASWLSYCCPAEQRCGVCGSDWCVMTMLMPAASNEPGCDVSRAMFACW
jgi:hypothetical protein